MRRSRKPSGVILISVLWVLVILSVIALAMGQRSALQISVLESSRGKMRSHAAARGGIAYVLDLMQRSPSLKDTLYCSGITLQENKTPQDIFSHIPTGEHSYAVVQWSAEGFGKEHVDAAGLRDEQGKININAVSESNYHALSALFALKGLAQKDADDLALAVARYMQAGQPAKSDWFEDSGHGSLRPKKKPYDDVYELLNVRGVSRELFDAVKDDLTVCSDMDTGVWVNVNTASDAVIAAMANAAARDNPEANAEQIVTKARAMRDGQDGRPFTSDDGQELSDVDYKTWPPTLRQTNGGCLKAKVVGVDAESRTRTAIDVVIRRSLDFSGNRITAWQRD